MIPTMFEQMEKVAEERTIRRCDECKEAMINGFLIYIYSGEEYYCKQECLHKHYTEEEYQEMYNGGFGDSFWTEWETIYEED